MEGKNDFGHKNPARRTHILVDDGDASPADQSALTTPFLSWRDNVVTALEEFWKFGRGKGSFNKNVPLLFRARLELQHATNDSISLLLCSQYAAIISYTYIIDERHLKKRSGENAKAPMASEHRR